jgi:hypothetical protein
MASRPTMPARRWRQHVEFAHRGVSALAGCQLLGQAQQAVGLAAHGAGNDHHLVAGTAHLATRLATLRMRSVEPIDVPPYL